MFCLFLLQVLDVTFTKRESDAMFTVQICTHVDCSVIQSHFHCSDLLACSSSTVHIAFRFHCSHLMSRTLPTLILCRLHCSAVMLQTLFFFSVLHKSRTLFMSLSLFTSHVTYTAHICVAFTVQPSCYRHFFFQSYICHVHCSRRFHCSRFVSGLLNRLHYYVTC